MRLIETALIAAAMASGAGPAHAEGDPIALHRWASRLLVVIAPDAGHPNVGSQLASYRATAAGNVDRDLLLVPAIGDAGDAKAIRRRFSVPPDGFRSILIGKDGAVKLSSAEPIAADRLFAEIDAMPMRRDEMRRSVRR